VFGVVFLFESTRDAMLEGNDALRGVDLNSGALITWSETMRGSASASDAAKARPFSVVCIQPKGCLTCIGPSIMRLDALSEHSCTEC